MATNRDLLKEAIADAKAVKEMAIANAKMALEEAFTPQLKSMLSTRLQEMEDEDEDEDEYVDYTMGKKTDSNQLPNPPKSLNIDINEEDEMEDEFDEDEMEDELNLDELLAELNEEDDDDMDEDDEEDMKSETEEESMDLEDMSEEDLKSFIEDVIADMVKAGELEAGEDMEGEDMEDEDMEDEEEEEVNIDELLAEIDSMDEMYHDNEDDMMEEVEELDEVNEFGLSDMEFLISLLTPVLAIATGYARGVIKSKLQKAKNAKELKAKAEEIAKESEMEKSEGVETLRSELNEVNLLNAKLLYTNKIFKSKNLTESQKVKVLSSFDKTTTVKEVKLVYETLNGGITTSKKSLSENLGSASKAIGTTKKPIIEANDAFSRMREIAFYSAKH
jgi:hypothetical protein